ncbi:MAG: hypothetical protein HYV26_11645 [Candidatus Hydrogenedentes bacterium]|nr:hypothetical protein [Candidatus Hydrogenedentota bacterium]
MFDPLTGKALPYPAPPPAPEPVHQRKITREKWFEIVCVIFLIVGGVGYLAWRNSHAQIPAMAVETLGEAGALAESKAYKPLDRQSLSGRQIAGYTKPLPEFQCFMNLIGAGESLETAIIWLTPRALAPSPSASAMQEAVNEVANIASLLVPSSGEALRKAVRTSEFMGEAKRPYDKGVVGTSDGWKVTYVTYRSFDDLEQPALILLLQTLSAGADPALAEFNRTLYRAIEEGNEVKSALKAL